MNKLRAWWHRFILLFYRPPVVELPPVRETIAPPPVREEAIAPPPPPIPAPAPPPDLPNRHARRAWERERMKRDKFVTPQGPTPTKVPRSSPQQRAMKAPVKEIDDGRVVLDGDNGAFYIENELWGEFAFRDTILDQLDRYWVYLRRMKHHDADSYGFYRQIGATIVPPVTWFLHDGISKKKDRPTKRDNEVPALSPWWRANRPAFGCVTYGMTSRIEQDERDGNEGNLRLWVPKFLYFIKYSMPPPEVQPASGGDVYKMTIWWDRPFDKQIKRHGGTPDEYAVFVSSSGDDVHVLPVCKTEMISVPERRNGLRRFDVPQRRWSIPRHHVQWAKENGLDANRFLSGLFVEAAHTVERSNYSMVRIAVHKGDLTAVFGVEVKRIPYFFQDRDITLTENGVKQRVFHIVRPHVRVTGAKVPFHFRGLREFTWAGYRVKITVPLRDHFMVNECDVGAMDGYWKKRGDKVIHEPEWGKMLARQIDEGLGAMVEKKR